MGHNVALQVAGLAQQLLQEQHRRCWREREAAALVSGRQEQAVHAWHGAYPRRAGLSQGRGGRYRPQLRSWSREVSW